MSVVVTNAQHIVKDGLHLLAIDESGVVVESLLLGSKIYIEVGNRLLVGLWGRQYHIKQW